MPKKLFAAVGVGSLIALGGAVAAHAEVMVSLTADPSTITPAESTVVDGAARATFSSPEASTFEVVVINNCGGPALASTTITVNEVPPARTFAGRRAQEN